MMMRDERYLLCLGVIYISLYLKKYFISCLVTQMAMGETSHDIIFLLFEFSTRAIDEIQRADTVIFYLYSDGFNLFKAKSQD